MKYTDSISERKNGKRRLDLEKLVIHGGNRLFGEVEISGAKNAAVAIIPATLLAQDVCRIENVPNISDVSCMVKILSQMGAQIKYINKHTIEINTKTVNSYIVPHEMTKQLRASYYLIGALLGRYNRAKVALPGGCNFGVRPIDLHIRGFELLGATALVENAMINASADHLTGSPIYMDKVSVGATINIMLAAVKARGLTIIENAAKEPHIVDLANFLNAMGADVRGAGTDVIKIHGVQNLHGCTYSIIPDQIEAGTYMVAAAASGGDVIVKNVIPKAKEQFIAPVVASNPNSRLSNAAKYLFIAPRSNTCAKSMLSNTSHKSPKVSKDKPPVSLNSSMIDVIFLRSSVVFVSSV